MFAYLEIQNLNEEAEVSLEMGYTWSSLMVTILVPEVNERSIKPQLVNQLRLSICTNT